MDRLERRIATTRPIPPDAVADDVPTRFVADPVFAQWITDTFIAASGPLANDDHEHLLEARIGVLWTNAINVSKQRMVLATAEIPQVMGSAWKRERMMQQLRDWFDFDPDFVLTFYAPECLQLDNGSFCAVVEHELYHCAQALDRFGSPKFDEITGRPVYAIRGHDSEEFVGVMRRYGPNAVGVGTRDLVAAAKQKPLLAASAIEHACGTCMRKAA